ncbi:hypothetical protein EHP00_604 [Ecytonucleospora hepatopenaei]|uniref:Uncharacterized protein n=1 Tax=Ecytonucleospora hepatopenaei TaxID=646526 RepID=A0A1W0E7M5_9MICR|nr:hypothetical protein EHP00_604 [Ecytonucleospora hepatopenaei]
MIEDGIKLVINTENEANQKIKKALEDKETNIKYAEKEAVKQGETLRYELEKELKVKKAQNAAFLANLKTELEEEFNEKIKKLENNQNEEIIEIIVKNVANAGDIEENTGVCKELCLLTKNTC